MSARRTLRGDRAARLVRRALLLASTLLVLSLAATALARPGGGQSFSGGGSSSSGGGDGGADLVIALVVLAFEHPTIGVPLLFIVGGILIFQKLKERRQKDWSSGGDPGVAAPPTRAPSFDTLRTADPGFSRVVFEDFVYGLYAEVARTRGLPGAPLDRMSAYLSAEAMTTLRALPAGPVESVIIGAMTPVAVEVGPSGSRVTLNVEANYTEAGKGVYAVERWTLARGPGARSRTPDRVGMLGCPSCGAPVEALFGGQCSYCRQQVNSGAFDWLVQHIQVLSRENRGPMLTTNVAERGNDAPTIYDPGLREALQALQAKDPSFDVGAAQTRVGVIFEQFQRAWTARELAPMRPFMSDPLFATQAYWVSAYLAQHLRNLTERARIMRLELVKVSSDPYFDAITFRLFATGLDYTVDDDGRVVSGSRTKERAYTEYWTLIRGTNRKGPPRSDLVCPNCGAPLAVSMAGHCGYCQAKITSGDFDWVLSRIEQDEVYAG